jgi:hypothetical protein
MSKITELTELTTVEAGDLLPVVDVSDTTASANGTTKKGTITSLAASLGTSAPGTKVYRARLTQAGTAEPVATVLVNTLGETPTYGYVSTGKYTLNIVAPLFVEAKTFRATSGPVDDSEEVYVAASRVASTTQMTLYVQRVTNGSSTDSRDGDMVWAIFIQIQP